MGSSSHSHYAVPPGRRVSRHPPSSAKSVCSSTAQGHHRTLHRHPPSRSGLSCTFTHSDSEMAPPKKKTKLLVVLGVTLPVLACIIGIAAWAITTDVLRISPRINPAPLEPFPGPRTKTKDDLQSRSDTASETNRSVVSVKQFVEPKRTKQRVQKSTSDTAVVIPLKMDGEYQSTVTFPTDILKKLIADGSSKSKTPEFVVFAPVADVDAGSPKKKLSRHLARQMSDKAIIEDDTDLVAEESVNSEDLSQDVDILAEGMKKGRLKSPDRVKTINYGKGKPLSVEKFVKRTRKPSMALPPHPGSMGNVQKLPNASTSSKERHENQGFDFYQPTHDDVLERRRAKGPAFHPSSTTSAEQQRKGGTPHYRAKSASQFRNVHPEPQRPHHIPKMKSGKPMHHQTAGASHDSSRQHVTSGSRQPNFHRNPRLQHPTLHESRLNTQDRPLDGVPTGIDHRPHQGFPLGVEASLPNESVEGAASIHQDRIQKRPDVIESSPYLESQEHPKRLSINDDPTAGHMLGPQHRSQGKPDSIRGNPPGPHEYSSGHSQTQPRGSPMNGLHRQSHKSPKNSHRPSLDEQLQSRRHIIAQHQGPQQDFDNMPAPVDASVQSYSGHESMIPNSNSDPQYFAPPPQNFHTKTSYTNAGDMSAPMKTYESIAQTTFNGDPGTHHHHHHHHHHPNPGDNLSDMNLPSAVPTNDADRLGTISLSGGSSPPRGITLQIGGGGGRLTGLLPIGALGIARGLLSTLLPRPALGLNSKVFVGLEVGRGGGFSIG